MFALITKVLSADLKTEVTPCQFGGTPDCASCSCFASMGLAAVGTHKVAGIVSLHSILKGSVNIGRLATKREAAPQTTPEFRIFPTRDSKASGGNTTRP